MHIIALTILIIFAGCYFPLAVLLGFIGLIFGPVGASIGAGIGMIIHLSN